MAKFGIFGKLFDKNCIFTNEKMACLAAKTFGS